MEKLTPDEIRVRFDKEVERFSNLETGQTAAIDSPLQMDLITSAAYYTNPDDSGGGELPRPESHFIGSEQCNTCHQDIYETFIKSGHPYKLPKVENGEAPTYPFTSLDYIPPYFQNNVIVFLLIFEHGAQG